MQVGRGAGESQWIRETRFGTWFLSTEIWLRYVLAPAFHELARLLGPHRGSFESILDAGCGHGLALPLLEQRFHPEVLIGVDVDALQEPVAGWIRLLMRELAPELERLSEPEDEAAEQRWGVQLLLGATASDSRRRDPLMPYRTSENEGLKDRAWWSAAGGLWLETHNVAAETRLSRDTWLNKKRGDPDGQFPGGYARTDNAYLTLAFPWGNIWVGRFERNWGPIGQTGMMIGDNATPYPQIGLDLGRGSLSFRFMAGELESIDGRQRYIVGNRLDYRRGNFWVSVGESVLYSGESAVLRLFNPLEFLTFDEKATHDPQSISSNLMFNAMFWARVGQGTLYGEFALDDFDLKPRTGADRPAFATLYQLSLGGRYLGVSDRPNA